MVENRLAGAEESSPGMGVASDGAGPTTGKKSVFAVVAGIPRGILTLVRERKMGGASLRLLLASVFAFAFIFAWSVVMTIALLVFGVPMAMLSDGAVPDVAMQGLMFLLALPAVIAGLILVLGTVLGAALGFLGLFLGHDNKLLGAIGSVVNLLLLAFFLLIMLLAVGLAQ